MFKVERIASEQTHPLRAQVLRVNRPAHEVVFPRDDDAETAHFGAFQRDEIVGIVTLMRQTAPKREDALAYQLRGMATAPSVRGAGAGAALVEHCIAYARAQRAPYIWCNARVSAEGFYRKMGFATFSDVFEVANFGPHVLMQVMLTEA